jgi:hypothetical protein
VQLIPFGRSCAPVVRATAAASLCAAAAAAAAQSPLQLSGDVPMAEYLALLSQVAPPAREGADAYLSAFQARCGRQLTTLELRRAMAAGSGDPTLMAMIRAAATRDQPSMLRLRASVTCTGGQP